MSKYQKLINDPRFKALDLKDKHATLDRLYDDLIADGEADKIDRFKAKALVEIGSTFHGETDRRKKFLQKRYDALRGLFIETEGATPRQRASAMRRFMLFDQQLENEEYNEIEKIARKRELAAKILIGDEDEEWNTRKEEGIVKGFIGAWMAEAAEEMGAFIGWGKDEKIFGPTARKRRRDMAAQAREELREMGVDRDEEFNIIRNLRKEITGDFKDKNDFYMIDEYGEMRFNPESLIRFSTEKLSRKIMQADVPEEAKKRALDRMEAEKREKIEAFEIAMHATAFDDVEGNSFEDRADKFLSAQEDRKAIDKFFRASGLKLGNVFTGVLGGTAGALGATDFSKFMAETVDSSNFQIDQLKQGKAGRFTSDLVGLLPDLAIAWAGGALGGALSKASKARAVSYLGSALSKASKTTRASKATMLEKVGLFGATWVDEAAMIRTGVSAASGYSAASRMVNEALGQDLPWDEAVLLGLKQLLITGLVTYVGANTGTERIATGEAFKAQGRRFWKDFIGKDVIGEGFEEAIDELISGVLVEREMHPDMTIGQIVDGAIHAFGLGLAMGPVGGVRQVYNKVVRGLKPPPSPSELLKQTTQQLETIGIEEDEVALTQPGGQELAAAFTEEPGTQRTTDESIPAPKRGEEASEAETPPGVQEGITEPSGGRTAPKKVDLGSGVQVEESEGGPSVEEQVFGTPPAGQRVVPRVSRKDIQVKNEKGTKRVFYKRARTDRIYDESSGTFKTDESGKVGFLTKNVFEDVAKPKIDEGAPKADFPAKPKGASARARFTTEKAGTAEEKKSRTPKLGKARAGEDLDSLEKGSTVVFGEVENGGNYDPKTNRVTIDPDKPSGARLRTDVLPRVTAQKAVAKSDTSAKALAEILGDEALNKSEPGGMSQEDKAKRMVVAAVMGDENAKAAITEAAKNGDVKVKSQIRNIIDDIQNANTGPNSKSVLRENSRNLLEDLEGVEIFLGAGSAGQEAVTVGKLGVFETTRAVFDKLVGKRKDNTVTINSGREGDTGVLAKTLPVGSVIEVKKPGGTEKRQTVRRTYTDEDGTEKTVIEDADVVERWIVKNTHTRFDGTVQHDLEKIGTEEAAIGKALNKIFAGEENSARREELLEIIDLIRRDRGSQTQERLQNLLRRTVAEITSDGYAEENVRFEREKNNGFLQGRLAAVNPRLEKDGTISTKIIINEDAVYRLVRMHANRVSGKNEVMANAAAEDISNYLSTVMFEEVIHEQALSVLEPSDIVSMMRDWWTVAKEDLSAKAQLLRWYGYAEGEVGRNRKSDEALWRELEDLASDTSPEGKERFNNKMLQVGHEALAGFVQLLNTGNTTLSMEGVMLRWLGEFGSSSLSDVPTAGSEGTAIRRRSMLNRLGEMLSRMVEAVRRFINAHRQIHDLPPEFKTLVDAIDAALAKNQIKVPDFVNVKARALDQGVSDLDATFRAVDDEFSLHETQQSLRYAMNRVSRRTGTHPREFLNLEWTGPGRAGLVLDKRVKDALDEEELAEISENIRLINESGRPTIIARNAATAQDIDFVVRRMQQSEHSLLGSTDEQKRKNLEAAEKAAGEMLSEVMGIPAEEIVATMQRRYEAFIKAQRDNALAEKTLKPVEINFNDKFFGKEGEVYRELEDAYEVVERRLREQPLTPEEARKAGEDLEAARRKLVDYKMALLGYLPVTGMHVVVDVDDEGNPVYETVEAEVRTIEGEDHAGYRPAQTPESLSELGLEMQRQRRVEDENLRRKREIIDATPNMAFANMRQMLMNFSNSDRRASVLGTEIPIGGRNMFVKALLSPDMKDLLSREGFDYDGQRAVSAFTDAARLVEVTSRLQEVREDMNFALLGGRPPSKMLTIRGRPDVDAWRPVNLRADQFQDTPVYFHTAKIARTPLEEMGAPDENIEQQNFDVASTQFGARMRQAHRLHNDDELYQKVIAAVERRNLAPHGSREMDEANAELRAAEADLEALGLRVQFGDAYGRSVGITFLETLPSEVAWMVSKRGEAESVDIGKQVSDHEKAVFTMFGVNKLTLRTDQSPADAEKIVKRQTMRNARVMAAEITEQMVERVFQGDQLLDDGVLTTGGFSLERGRVVRRFTPDNDPIDEIRLIVPDQLFDIPNYPDAAITDDFDWSASLAALLSTGYITDIFLDVSAKLDRMENDSSVSDAAIFSHEYGVTPAGLAYQAVAIPFVAMLARMKGYRINWRLENRTTKDLTIEEIMVLQAGDDVVKAQRIRALFASLAPGIESSSAWGRDGLDAEKMVLHLSDFRRQLNAANLIYEKTMENLRSRRFVEKVDRRAKTADENQPGAGLELPMDVDVALRLHRQAELFAQERRDKENPEFESILSVIRPDRAHKLLEFFVRYETRDSELLVKTAREGGDEYVMRGLDDPRENRYGVPVQYLNELFTSVEKELQNAQNAENRMARLRTIVLMELHGFDFNKVRKILSDPRYATPAQFSDGSVQYVYDMRALDNMLITELTRLAEEERSRGIVQAFEANPKGEYELGNKVVDSQLAEMAEKFPEESRERIVLDRVLQTGGLVMPNFRPDDIFIEEQAGMTPRHQQSTRMTLTHLASLIPGLRIVQGNVHHDNADETVPTIQFVGDASRPILVMPFRYDSLVTNPDMHRAMRDMVNFIGEQAGVPIVDIARTLMAPIQDLMSGAGKARTLDFIMQSVRSQAMRPAKPKGFDPKTGSEPVDERGNRVGWGWGRDGEEGRAAGLTPKEENMVRGAVSFFWDSLVTEVKGEIAQMQLSEMGGAAVANVESLRASNIRRSGTDDAYVKGYGFTVDSQVNESNAADMLVHMFNSDGMKRLLAYSSIGLDRQTFPDAKGWAAMGNLMRADLMTVRENLSIPRFIEEMASEIDWSDDALAEDIMMGIRKAHEEWIENEMEREGVSDVSVGSYVLGMHGAVPDGQNAANDLLIGALTQLGVKWEKPPEGLTPYERPGGLTEAEARQVMSLFSPEEIVRMAHEMEMPFEANPGARLTVPEIMAFSAEAAQVIRARYTRLARTHEDIEKNHRYPSLSRWGFYGGSDWLGGNDPRGKHFRENNLNSGRYSMAVILGFDEAIAADSGLNVLNVRERLGSDRREYVTRLREWMEEKGLPTTMPNRNAEIAKMVHRFRKEALEKNPGLSGLALWQEIADRYGTAGEIRVTGTDVGRVGMTARRVESLLAEIDRRGIENIDTIDIVEEAWEKTNRARNLNQETIDQRRRRIRETTRQARALDEARERLEVVRSALEKAETAAEFKGILERSEIFDVLVPMAQTREIVGRMVKNFFNDGNRFATSVAELLVEKYRESGALVPRFPVAQLEAGKKVASTQVRAERGFRGDDEPGRSTMEKKEVLRGEYDIRGNSTTVLLQDLVEWEGTEEFGIRRDVVLDQLAGFEGLFGARITEISSRIRREMEEIDSLEKDDEILKRKRRLISLSTNLDNWIQKTTAVVDAQFGEGMLGRVERFRNRAPVHLPRGFAGVSSMVPEFYGRLEREVRSGAFGEKLARFHNSVMGLTQPRGLMAKIEEHVTSQNLESLARMSPNNPNRQVGEFSGSLGVEAGEGGVRAAMAEFAIDLEGLGLNLQETLRAAEQSDDPVGHVTEVILPAIKRSFEHLPANMDLAMEEAQNGLAADFIAGRGRIGAVLDAAERLENMQGLTRAEAQSAVLAAVDRVLEQEGDFQEDQLIEFHEQEANRLIEERNFRNYIATFRNREARRARIDGNPEQVELTQHVLTRLAKIHAEKYMEAHQQIDSLDGLDRIEEAVRMADDAVLGMEQMRRAVEGATGLSYSVVDNILIPADVNERVAGILRNRGNENPSEEDLKFAIEELKLFAATGLLHDRSDFPWRRYSELHEAGGDEEWTEERYYQRVKNVADRVFEKNLSGDRASGKPFVFERPNESQVRTMERLLEGRDMFAEAEALPREMYAYLLMFDDWMTREAPVPEQMATDQAVIDQIQNLKNAVDSFLGSTGARDAPYDEVRDVNSRLASELLPLYTRAKAFVTSQNHGVALEAGFVNPSILEAGTWKPKSFYRGLMHQDAKVRKLFARTLEAQQVAQAMMGVFEYGVPVSGLSSMGRAGHLSFEETINKAILDKIPRRRSKRSAGLLKTIDLEEASSGYFTKTVLSYLTSGRDVQQRATNLLRMMDLSMSNMGLLEAAVSIDFNELKKRPGEMANYLRATMKNNNVTVLSERKIAEALFTKLRPHLEAIRDGDETAVEKIVEGMSREAREYGNFLDDVFGYMKHVFQAHGQLISGKEFSGENVNTWADGGNRHLLDRSNMAFSWKRIWRYRKGLEDRGGEADDAVSLRGAKWLKNPMVSFDPNLLQILDVSGVRAPVELLNDMSYRINNYAGIALLREMFGEVDVKENKKLDYLNDRRGAFGTYFRGQAEQSDWDSMDVETRMTEIGMSLAQLMQTILRNDVMGQDESTAVQRGVEDVGMIGMGTKLISFKQLYAQSVFGMAAYAGIYDRGNVGSTWEFAKAVMGNFLHLTPLSTHGSLSQRAHRVEQFVRENGFTIYLRNAEGIDLFYDAARAATPKFSNLSTTFNTGHGYLNRVGGTLDAMRNVPRLAMRKGIKAGLARTIGAAEKVTAHTIFMWEIKKGIEARMAADPTLSETHDTDVTIDKILEGEYADVISNDMRTQARIAVVDLLAESDTSKKGTLFQRTDSVFGEIARGLFSTFSNHLVTLAGNSYASGDMMVKGADKETKVSGARLLATNVLQNVAYQVARYEAVVAGMTWLAAKSGLIDEEDKEDVLKWCFGLGEGEDERFKTIMGWVSLLGFGAYRPYGYDMRNNRFSDEKFRKDVARLGVRGVGDVIAQMPGPGLFFSTNLGGDLQELFTKMAAESFFDMDLSSGEFAGISLGPPGEDGQLSASGFSRFVYNMSKGYRNSVADRSYFTIGINHLLSWPYFESNAQVEDVSNLDRLRLVIPMLPFIPREARYGTPVGWKSFTEAVDSRVWHDRGAKSRRERRRNRRRNRRKNQERVF